MSQITPPATNTLVVTSGEAEERGERTRPIDWEICRRLFVDYMWRYPKLQMIIIGYAAALAIINTLIPVLLTTTLSWAIDVPERWQNFSTNVLGGLIPPTMTAGVITGAVLAAFAAGLYYAAMRLRIYAVNRLSENVVHDLRCDIFNHVQRLHMAFFDRTKMGWILSRGTSDVNAIRHAVAQVIPRTLLHTIETVLFLSIMLYMDVPLTLVLMLLGPAFWFVNTWFRKRVGDAYRQVQFSMSRITANLAETVAGIRVTQSYAREELNTTLFRNLCLDHRKSNMRAAKIHGTYIPILDFFNQLVVAIIVGFGGWRALNGDISWPEVLGFLFFTGRFFIAIQVHPHKKKTNHHPNAGREPNLKHHDTHPQGVDTPPAQPHP
ncbi:MAG: ABC transporter ATP-binding protein, partial [Planctomycetota bacterium]